MCDDHAIAELHWLQQQHTECFAMDCSQLDWLKQAALLYLKGVIAAISQQHLMLTRWVVHCLHVCLTPVVQGWVALDSCAILLSGCNLTSAGEIDI